MDSGKITDEVIDGVQMLMYHHCLSQIQCIPPSLRCINRQYTECRQKHVEFSETLASAYDDMPIGTVENRKWDKTDRSTLETMKQGSDEFVVAFGEQLELLIQHYFVARMQSSYFRELKAKIGPGEFAVIGDFPENYSMTTQDKIQSHHWNKMQATIHPFVVYCYQGTDVHHLSYAAISDWQTHDTVAAHLFQGKFIDYIESKIGTRLRKMYYSSDESAAQYKNCKIFAKISFYNAIFGVEAK